jgi:predicted aldo/keto reductase-like oxidoreductase
MYKDPKSFPLRNLGKTREMVSCIGMGGSHLGQKDLPAKEAIRLIRAGIDHGITFMDNSWDYDEGEAERRMGKALQDGYRQRAFLMTKIDGRTSQSATEQLEESLKRLKTDCVDLLQHHEVIRYEDVDRIVASGGAGEALEKARRAGKCRYIGFTGHKDPHIHLYMLDRARESGMSFDAVQLPLNPMDAHYRSFGVQVVPRLVSAGIAVLGMKAFGHGVLLKSKVVSPEECLRYALSLPTSVVITGIDSDKLLRQAVKVATNFEPMSQAELDDLLARTAAAARHGEYELFKTSAHFDSTAEHPEYLGEELKRVAQLAKS